MWRWERQSKPKERVFWSIICCLGIQGWGGESGDEVQGIKNSGQWGVTGWPPEPFGAISAQLFVCELVLGTHCGHCIIHLCTSYTCILYQVEGFLSILSAVWRESRVGGR